MTIDDMIPLPEVESRFGQSVCRTIETGNLVAWFDIRRELTRRRAMPMGSKGRRVYWIADEVPLAADVPPVVTMDVARTLLACGSTAAAGPGGTVAQRGSVSAQQVAALYRDGFIDGYTTEDAVEAWRFGRDLQADEVSFAEALDLVRAAGVAQPSETLRDWIREGRVESRTLKGGNLQFAITGSSLAIVIGEAPARGDGPEGYRSIRAVAEELGVSGESVRRWAQRNDAVRRVGSRTYVDFLKAKYRKDPLHGPPYKEPRMVVEEGLDPSLRPWMTIGEAADMLGVAHNRMRDAVTGGHCPRAIKLPRGGGAGGQWRVPCSDVVAWSQTLKS